MRRRIHVKSFEEEDTCQDRERARGSDIDIYIYIYILSLSIYISRYRSLSLSLSLERERERERDRERERQRETETERDRERHIEKSGLKARRRCQHACLNRRSARVISGEAATEGETNLVKLCLCASMAARFARRPRSLGSSRTGLVQ
jgi:hypothetical protein